MDTFNSYAKINLGLSLFGKREDGFHNLETVMHEIDLSDEIYIEKALFDKDEIVVEGERIEGENLIATTLKYLRDRYEECPYFHIRLKKNIPMGAGLGGGSSNAIVVLKYASTFCEKSTQEELECVAATLGSDTNFFLSGGTALCKGRGEQIEQLEDKCFYFNLILPNIHCSTPEVFKNCSVANYSAIDMRELWNRGEIPGNDLMTPCFNAYPEMESLFSFINKKVDGLFLSGSGSTLFTYHENSKKCLDAFERLNALNDKRFRVVKAKSYYRS